MNILELNRISLGHTYRGEYSDTGGEARAGMGFAGTGSGLQGSGTSAAQAGQGGSGGGKGYTNEWGAWTPGSDAPAPDYQGYLDQLAADKAAAEAQAAREQAAAEARDQAARDQAFADSYNDNYINYGGDNRGWAGAGSGYRGDESGGSGWDGPASVEPTVDQPTAPIEQTLTDAGLVSLPQVLVPITAAPAAPDNTVASVDVTNPFNETLDNEGLIAALSPNQVPALKPKQVGGLTSDQVNDILDSTEYPEWAKDLIRKIQPDPNSTLGLLGINPGITYDQYHDVITPEQNNARMQKFGSLVFGAANMLVAASPVGPLFNTAKIAGNVISGKQTVGEALTQMGTAALAGKLGISSSVLTKSLNGDLGGAAQSYITSKLASTIASSTGLPASLVSAVLKDADINKGTGDSNSTTNIASKTIDSILGTGKTPINQDKLKNLNDSIANFTSDEIAALNSNDEEELPSELEPYRIDVTAGNQKESVGVDFDYSKLPLGTDLATQEDRDNGLASYDVASNSWVVSAEDGEPVPTTVTYGEAANGALAPVTVTAKRPPVLDPVYVTAKRPPLVPLTEMPPEPDLTVAPVDVVAPVAVATPAVTPDKTPTDKTTPTTPDKTTPTPAAADHFYGTITQGQPTTLADIKYFLEMDKADILPPNVEQDILELLINQSSQPKSVEELLNHLRS